MAATSLLGFGFNIFGRASLASGTTLPVIKTTVNAPDDNIVASPGDESTSVHAWTFTSREQVTEHFAASASLSYSGLVFSGEFSAKYQSESANDTQTAYGLYEVLRPATITKLAEADVNVLSDSFGSSEDVLNLPSTFGPDTAEQFFRVFRRFGTHVVTEVTLGGKLSAYTSAQLTSSMTSQQAEANMKMEYAGLFSAEGSAAWGNVTQDWGSDREISFDVVGGQPGPLAGFTPDINATAGQLVADWLGTVDAAPAIVDFQLSPLSIAFDGQTATAVDQAIAAYLTSLLILETWEYTMPRPVGPTDPNYPPQYASTVTLPGQAPEPQPGASGFWGQATQAYGSTDWMWVSILDAQSPSYATAGVLSQGYFFSDGLADKIAADIAAARAAISEPLVLVLGEFGGYNVGSGQTTGTLIPGALQDLLGELGFDLQGTINEAGDVFVLMSVAAVAGSDPVAVSSTPFSMDPTSAPTRVAAQYDAAHLQLVDATGTIVSTVDA